MKEILKTRSKYDSSVTIVCDGNVGGTIVQSCPLHLLYLGIRINHNIEHVTNSFQDGRVAIATSRSHRERTKNHCIYLVFPILFQREDPSHIIALHYPKSTQFLDISDAVPRKILQPCATCSLLPDRNLLRKVSFSWIEMSY